VSVRQRSAAVRAGLAAALVSREARAAATRSGERAGAPDATAAARGAGARPGTLA